MSESSSTWAKRWANIAKATGVEGEAEGLFQSELQRMAVALQKAEAEIARLRLSEERSFACIRELQRLALARNLSSK